MEDREKEESTIEEQQAHFEDETHHDRFTSFMFGSRRPHHERPPLFGNRNSLNSHQNQSDIDYEQLMMSIDAIWESVQGLKPIFQKFYPLIQQFWKKK
ncbi:hypothetical protein PH210_02580 [Paenibacillus sp. BSR1-1]|uniref:hypothetical protein n=1 Tax=Paenibacillus sp. BSR1-1 TaxID=3020845 RepID=UPI0025AEDF17|nr:hypothetical protein [Paenibacillus sp. BSR1-1]MDN3015089.1 hypothetical protein [Paenibacillus sp. BSR1-1]